MRMWKNNTLIIQPYLDNNEQYRDFVIPRISSEIAVQITISANVFPLPVLMKRKNISTPVGKQFIFHILLWV